MEKYDNLGMVGEGSYGMVMKCKHKESGQIVAIKKFLESEDDKMVKKIAMREVRMLRKLRHENLVNLIEVFRRKKRLYLVFEFVDHTVLDDLEKYPNGLSEMTVRKILWQVLRGVEFCHSHNIIHRDIKPENILNSRNGVIKLCDFGFARTLAAPGEIYTDYVATRWYRAPELLVGDTKYGRAVDIWAVGCLITEMLTGDPLFPGDSDIDQLYLIIKCFGNLCPRHREIFQRNPLFAGMRLPDVRDVDPLEKKFPKFSSDVIGLMKQCLKLDPNDRPSSSLLLRHNFFKEGHFEDKVLPDLRARINKENAGNLLARKEANEKKEERLAKKKKKAELIQNTQDEKEKEKSIEDIKNAKNKKSSEKKNKEDQNRNQAKNSPSPKTKTSRGSNKQVTPATTPPEKKKKTNKKEVLQENKDSNLANGTSHPVQDMPRLPIPVETPRPINQDTPRGGVANQDTPRPALENMPRLPAVIAADQNYLLKTVTSNTQSPRSGRKKSHKAKDTESSNSTPRDSPTKSKASVLSESKLTFGVSSKAKESRSHETDGSSSAPNEKTSRDYPSKSSSDASIHRKSKSELSNGNLSNSHFEKKEKSRRSPASLSPDKPHHSILPVVISPQPNSKTSSPDPLHAATSIGAPAYAGSPALRNADKFKKMNMKKSSQNAEAISPQSSFDKTMYPDKTSHFEKMMMSMQSNTSINHPAIKKTTTGNTNADSPVSVHSTTPTNNFSNISGNHLSFYSQNNFRGNTNKDEKKKDSIKEDKRKDTTKDKEVNPLSLWSQTGTEDKTSPNKSMAEQKQRQKFEEKKRREKSPRRKENKAHRHQSSPNDIEEKSSKDDLPESLKMKPHPTKLPNLGSKFPNYPNTDREDSYKEEKPTKKQKHHKHKSMIPSLEGNTAFPSRSHHKLDQQQQHPSSDSYQHRNTTDHYYKSDHHRSDPHSNSDSFHHKSDPFRKNDPFQKFDPSSHHQQSRSNNDPSSHHNKYDKQRHHHHKSDYHSNKDRKSDTYLKSHYNKNDDKSNNSPTSQSRSNKQHDFPSVRIK